ncbi:MAG: methyltransferase [Thiomicrorhabdus chilensis]|uniref:methyltransferase family protein n=1 Tax=Thiomicrorhabdus chilensis TaxID=63656 RepID=UPI00299EAB68|nr:methyltransferase [Thiomicrorhabdus chilensis]MDX1348378.1 methyltransferase [Thiomicrorhabdus chilensis]
MTRIKHPIISFSLVALQFTLIGILLLILPLSLNSIILGVQALAIIIGLWAVQTMHLGHFNIVPDPMPEIELVTHGPYRFIRHPMYFSILLFFLPLIVLNLSWLPIALYASLILALLIKATYEESLLVDTLPEYEAYQQISKRIIPFVF